jgi:L-serine dehydratase
MGPVMRGPSSSHTAASARIGRLAAGLLGEEIKSVLVEFTPDGSLATTYDGQGSDIGIAAGLLGLEASSSQMNDSLSLIKGRGIDLKFEIREYPATHPNTYRLTLESVNGRRLQIIAISTGGGMVKITRINGFEVDVQGGYYEFFLFVKSLSSDAVKSIPEEFTRKYRSLEIEDIKISVDKGIALINIKTTRPISNGIREEISSGFHPAEVLYAPPVLPVLSGTKCTVPFTTAADLIGSLPGNDTQLWEMAVMYESQRGNFSEEEVWKLAAGIHQIMRESVITGLKGTSYKDRILGRQSHLIDKGVTEGRIPDSPLMNNVIRNTMAVMESKSSFQVIVAAPTAGSCGVIPGAVTGCADSHGFTEEECVKAVLSAGMIGVLIATQSTFSAEVAGCQAECGAASAMAAAAIVQLLGGNAIEAVNAASFALQNMLGLICDPVANRVEVPCLGKNILGAVNGLTSANITMAGVNTLIPLDEVIKAMDSVGASLPRELRCTGCGGLSVTNTAREIERKLHTS